MIEVEIGLAEPADVATLPAIERDASAIFSPEDLPPEIAAHTLPIENLIQAQREGRLIVARGSTGSVLGFAHVMRIDDGALLEELDVDPKFGRRGIGRRLVEAACGWARQRRLHSITLSTFREVAWNAPFYARLGFVVCPAESWTEALRRLRDNERRAGLDLDRRVIMRRPIAATDLEFCPD